jgi:outer membrane protein OmpA-like peptidoglycan-associated protein
MVRLNRSTLRHLAFVALASGWPLGGALAQGAVVAQSGTATSADCAGSDARVDGSGNSVIFRNACRSLTVNGSGNTIQVELQSGAALALNGSGNRVSYAPVGGAQDAAVSDHGQGNSVQRTAAIQAGTATIASSPAISGGLSIRGPNGESVQIGPAGILAIPAPGTGTAVSITPGGIAAAPDNGAAPGATAAAPGQLMLSGDGQTRDMPCSSANVFINGGNGRFTLHGGCKALFIRGDGDVVHAELAPGAQIAIQGSNSQVYFLLTPTGPDPAVLVTGSNSRAFRVQHIEDSNGVEIPATIRAGSLGAAPGGVVVMTPQAALAAAQSESIGELQHHLSAVQTPQGTIVELSGDVLFDFDQDRLRPDAARSVAELAVLIARSHPSGLRIVGHTDSIGTPQYNLDLSDRRARSVERWLLGYGGVQVAALEVEGRGASDPVAPNALPDGRDNPDGRQQNRRVEILLLR